MKTDYLSEARELIEKHYSPVPSLFAENDYTVKKTLSDMHREITNILPEEWVYQSDIYEILAELGFKSFLYTFEEVRDTKGKLLRPEKTVLLYLLDKKTAAL